MRRPFAARHSTAGDGPALHGVRTAVARQGALYQIVHDHFETFRAEAARLRDGDGLPRFVEHAFRTVAGSPVGSRSVAAVTAV